MRTVLTVLLSMFLFCSCSHKQAGEVRKSTDLIETGKNLTWPDGCTLYVQKKDGSSLEGIRLITKSADGRVTTFTADKGTVSEASSPNSVKITLYDARNGRMTIHKFVVNLTR